MLEKKRQHLILVCYIFGILHVRVDKATCPQTLFTESKLASFSSCIPERTTHDLPRSSLLKAAESRKRLASNDAVGPSRGGGLGSYKHIFWESGW